MDYETILKMTFMQLCANDTLRKRVIRLLMSSIELAEVAKGSKLSDSEFIALVQKRNKTKNDTIVDAEKANRPEMVKEQLEEIKVLEGYKPKQLSEAELVQMAEEVIRETGATSPKDMGKVLKVLIPKLAGRATNQDASRVVKDCLTNRS